ncbi:MAG TPA: hypothetical protein VK459_21890, partial [Polyangiaceae bacterium]|nr:hypothetical protein [Polyangiaceae bacterium]
MERDPLRRPVDWQATVAAERLQAFDVQAYAAYHAGMKRRQPAQAIQYTLRNVPPVLDRALRRRAKQLSK